MNKSIITSFLLFVLVLVGCQGSDTYQGTWNALDSKGNKMKIAFTPKTMSIKWTDGKIQKWEYTQNSVSIKNSTRKYGIQQKKGKFFSILFPIPSNIEKGAIADQNGTILFIIGKSKYYTYDEVFGMTK